MCNICSFRLSSELQLIITLQNIGLCRHKWQGSEPKVTQEHKLAISPHRASSLTLLIEYIKLVTSLKGNDAARIKETGFGDFLKILTRS
jgi:hypothetical protein